MTRTTTLAAVQRGLIALHAAAANVIIRVVPGVFFTPCSPSFFTSETAKAKEKASRKPEPTAQQNSLSK